MEGIVVGYFFMLCFIILLVIVICIIENENGKLREIVKQSRDLEKYLRKKERL